MLRSRWWWQVDEREKQKKYGPNLFFLSRLPAATIATAAIPIVGWDDFIALLPIAAERNPTDEQGAKLILAIGSRAMKSGGDKKRCCGRDGCGSGVDGGGGLSLTAIDPTAATIATAAKPIVGWDDFISLLPIASERNPTDGQWAKLILAIGSRAMKSGGDKKRCCGRDGGGSGVDGGGGLSLTAIDPTAATIATAAKPIVGWDDFIALLPIASERNPTDGQGAKLTLAIGNRAMKSGGDKKRCCGRDGGGREGEREKQKEKDLTYFSLSPSLPPPLRTRQYLLSGGSISLPCCL